MTQTQVRRDSQEFEVQVAIDTRRQQLLLLRSSQQVAVLQERQRPAHELHDFATQIIFSITLIAQSVAPAWSRDRAEPTLHPEAQRQLMQRMMTPTSPDLLSALTERELDVLRQIAQGHSNKEIAANLDLTEGTVKGYVSRVLAKLQVANRTQAAL